MVNDNLAKGHVSQREILLGNSLSNRWGIL